MSRYTVHDQAAQSLVLTLNVSRDGPSSTSQGNFFQFPQIPLPLSNMLSPIMSTVFSVGSRHSFSSKPYLSPTITSIVPFRTLSFPFPFPVPGSPDSFSESYSCIFFVLRALRQIPFFPLPSISADESTRGGLQYPARGRVLAVQGWD